MLQFPIIQPQLNSSQFSLLKFLSSILAYSSLIAWGIVGIIGIFLLVISLILSYHWRKFEIDKLVIGQAAIVYFAVSSVLLVTLVISLAVYLESI